MAAAAYKRNGPAAYKRNGPAAYKRNGRRRLLKGTGASGRARAQVGASGCRWARVGPAFYQPSIIHHPSSIIHHPASTIKISTPTTAPIKPINIAISLLASAYQTGAQNHKASADIPGQQVFAHLKQNTPRSRPIIPVHIPLI